LPPNDDAYLSRVFSMNFLFQLQNGRRLLGTLALNKF
jgi:hypothetical protein